MPNFEANVSTIMDRTEIAELVHRYCDALCQRNHDAWVETFANDGIWNGGRGEMAGRPALSATFKKVMELFDHVLQLTHNGAVKVDGDAARGRWYVTEYGLTAKGRRTLYIVHYDDEYRRTAEGWRFSRRTVTWHYQGPPDLSGNFGPPAGYST